MPPVLLMELVLVLLELQMEIEMEMVLLLLSVFWLSPPLQTHFRTPL